MKETICKIKPPSKMFIPLELYAVQGYHKRNDPTDELYIHKDVVMKLLERHKAYIEFYDELIYKFNNLEDK